MRDGFATLLRFCPPCARTRGKTRGKNKTHGETMKYVRSGGRVAAWILASAVAACGGGGGGGDTPAPVPPSVAKPPAITSQPAAASAITGATASFSVVASGSGLQYQWQKNGTAIAGANAASYTTGPLTASDHASAYSVVVSNADGSVTSAPALLNLVPSTDQQRFETWLLVPGQGSHVLRWNLGLSGLPVQGTHYLTAETASLAASPLGLGPQPITLSARRSLSQALVPPSAEPTRVLKDGVILVVPGEAGASLASYVGSAVQIDTLAQDAATVATSQRRSEFTVVPLSGLLSASPADFAHWHNSLFANPALLKPAATYAAGASYLRYTAHNVGDRYNVFDCTTATTGADVTPCASGTSLAEALTAGIASASDARTYHLADGSLATVGGVPVWVANTTRPLAATLSLTLQYRIYFALNGKVYTGALIKDGTLLGGSYFVSNPSGASVLDRLTFLPFQVRMNRAAVDSLGAALNF